MATTTSITTTYAGQFLQDYIAARIVERERLLTTERLP
jgi:hypothetical protein